MRHVLMHISDLHAGPPFRLKLAEQVAREAHELKPDLLVISGDFVQRADFLNQWQMIAAYRKILPGPQLVVNEGDTVTVNITNALPALHTLTFEIPAWPRATQRMDSSKSRVASAWLAPGWGWPAGGCPAAG